MMYAEKGNRVHRIDESEVQRYVEQGYTITDGKGTVIRETVPTDLPTLRLAYMKNAETIKQLQAQVADLEAENKALKAAKSEKAAAPAPADDAKANKRSKKSATEE